MYSAYAKSLIANANNFSAEVGEEASSSQSVDPSSHGTSHSGTEVGCSGWVVSLVNIFHQHHLYNHQLFVICCLPFRVSLALAEDSVVPADSIDPAILYVQEILSESCSSRRGET